MISLLTLMLSDKYVIVVTYNTDSIVNRVHTVSVPCTWRLVIPHHGIVFNVVVVGDAIIMLAVVLTMV
jgi:hypothetical protein